MIFRKKKPQKRVRTNKKPKTVPAKPKPPLQKPVTPIPDKKANDIFSDKSSSQPPKGKKVDYRKEFLNTFKSLTYRHRAWDIWRDFVIMFACALSNGLDKEHYEEREARYMKIIRKYHKEEQNLFPELAAHTVMALEENPEQDFLGGIFMELNLGNGKNGQFFTPYHVCQLMADIAEGANVAEQVEKEGYITIHDPCCGAGATLIAGVHAARKQLEKVNLNYQNHVLVVAQDIDETVALMCYIQLSLLGVAAYIKVGNTFTDPIAEGDSTENYWFTPMYFSDTWYYRRIFHNMDNLMKGDKTE